MKSLAKKFYRKKMFKYKILLNDNQFNFKCIFIPHIILA